MFNRDYRHLFNRNFFNGYVLFAFLMLSSFPSYSQEMVMGYCARTQMPLPQCMSGVQPRCSSSGSPVIKTTWFDPNYKVTIYAIGCSDQSPNSHYVQWRPLNNNCDVAESGYCEGEEPPTCSDFEELNPETNTCEPKNRCEAVAGTDVDVAWDSNVYGQSPGKTWCTAKGGGCIANYKGMAFCSNNIDAGNHDCIATYTVTSAQCTVDNSADHSWCTDAQCSNMQPPISQPITPVHKPDDPTTPVTPPSSNGSSGSGGSSSPQGVTDLPVEDTTNPDKSQALIDSVLNMNKDMNTLIKDFNEDANKDAASTRDQLVVLTDNSLELIKKNIEIHNNEKALITDLNSDVTTAINKGTNHLDKGVDTLGKKLDAIKSAIEGAPAGGGGGTGTDPSALSALQEIRCLLDEGCESETKQKPTANVNCKASIFECKGDVIQCALLKMEYENSCVTDELSQLEKALEGITNVNNVAMLVDDENALDYSKMDTQYLDNGVSFGSASCPSPTQISLTIPTVGSYSIDFSWKPACEWAQIMNPLVHIAGWILGLFIIFRAQGNA